MRPNLRFRSIKLKRVYRGAIVHDERHRKAWGAGRIRSRSEAFNEHAVELDAAFDVFAFEEGFATLSARRLNRPVMWVIESATILRI